MSPAKGSLAGSRELRDSIAGINFPLLASETHEINRQGKTLCPFHPDTHESCQIYENGYFCFACGAHGDALNWLEHVHKLSRKEAVKELKRRLGVSPIRRTKQTNKPSATCKTCESLPIEAGAYAAYVDRVGLINRIPKSLEGRGFLLEDLWSLGVCLMGEDALFPILNPHGEIVRIKRRHYQGKEKYSYTKSGTGSPAWCSPNFSQHDTVLVCEGEFNAMTAWCAIPTIAVMGVAGNHGCVWLNALEGKNVYCYADGDDSGQPALKRWAKAITEAGAAEVFTIKPLPMPLDFCDIAGVEGRDALREVLSCLR